MLLTNKVIIKLALTLLFFIFPISLLANYTDDLSLDQEIYRLSVKDRLEISIFGEPDLAAVSEIDRKGLARFKLIDDIYLKGLTTREAEELLENEYFKQRYLKKPQISINVIKYVKREVMILGQVVNSGPFEFPDGSKKIGIVELISRIGGFTGIAQENKVKVTRYVEEAGKSMQRKFTVNVEQLMSGYSSDGNGQKRFWIYPNDIVFVPESLF